MTVRLYQSTDGDAPKLSGEPGKLVQVLEACLVNGYGEKAGLGWQIDRLADHTKAALRSTDPAGSGCWLYLEDHGDWDEGLRVAKAFGLEPEAWDGFDAADDPKIVGSRFPTDDHWFGKSWSEDTSATPWVIVADERIFYFFFDPAHNWGTGTPGGFPHIFGDLVSYVPGDSFGCVFAANFSTPPALSTSGNTRADFHAFHDFNNYAARSASQTGSPKAGRGRALTQFTLSAGGINWPIQGTDTLALAHEVYWEESDGNLRGRLPGLFSYFHDGRSFSPTAPFDHGHTETLPDGRELFSVEYRHHRNGDGPAFAVFDVTGPWR